MNFLCGCSQEEKKHYSGELVPSFNGELTYTDKRWDKEGFEICPEHGQRLYGWASLNVQNEAGREVIDYSRKGTGGTLVPPADLEDRRDNRDPELVYAEMKAASNGHH